MAWTFVAAGTASNGNNATSLSPGLPSGWQANDLHLLLFSNFGGTNSRTPSPPSGWSTLPSGTNYWQNGTASMCLYYRVAQAGDSAPTLSLSGTGASNDTQCSRIFGFRPTSGRTPTVDVVGSTSTNASADNVGPITGITATSGRLIIIVGGKTNDWNGTATLSGWSLAGQNESITGNDAGNALLYQLSWGGGATGNLTITDNGGTASNGLGFGLLVTFHDQIADTVGTITNAATTSGSTNAIWKVGGSADGTATTSGTSAHVLPVVGNAVGAATVTGSGEAGASGSDGTAIGASTVAGLGATVWATGNTIANTATTSGVGVAFGSTIGTVNGNAAIDGKGGSIRAGSGSALGSATTTGLVVWLASTIGSSTNIGSATATSGATAGSIGQGTSQALVTGLAAFQAPTTGSAMGLAATTGIGITITTRQVILSNTATTQALAALVIPAQGQSTSGGGGGGAVPQIIND